MSYPSYDLTLNSYQTRSLETAIYPSQGSNLGYVALGLCEEAGEFAGQLKKMIRDDDGQMTETRHASLVKELGDVLWYCAAAAKELGVDLEMVAQTNLAKTQRRLAEGTLRGSGSER